MQVGCKNQTRMDKHQTRTFEQRGAEVHKAEQEQAK
jgi:hypothetical protein